MKTTALLLTVLATACAVEPAAPDAALEQSHVLLLPAAPDVAGDLWTIRPIDYLIDRPLHLTRQVADDGTARELDALVLPGETVTVDGIGLVEGWY